MQWRGSTVYKVLSDRTSLRKGCKLSSMHGVCWSLSLGWAVPSEHIRSSVGAGGRKLHVDNAEGKKMYVISCFQTWPSICCLMTNTGVRMRLSTDLVSTRNETTRDMTKHIAFNPAYLSEICLTSLVKSDAIWIGLTLDLLHIKIELTDWQTAYLPTDVHVVRPHFSIWVWKSI